jgi:ketopantoate hydroxymethyltransferase
MEKKKATISAIKTMKQSGKKLVMVTAYDYPSAVLVDKPILR